jgi:hypothetical protein
MAHGEYWIAKEIYRRELIRLEISTPEDQRDDKYWVIIEWIKSKIKELDDVTSGKKSG